MQKRRRDKDGKEIKISRENKRLRGRKTMFCCNCSDRSVNHQECTVFFVFVLSSPSVLTICVFVLKRQIRKPTLGHD